MVKQYIHNIADTFFKLAALTAVFALALGINYLAAWTGPTALPPNNNTPAPITTSGTPQVKDGNLSVGASANPATAVGLSVYGAAVTKGWQRIGGVTAPTQLLELTGTPGTDGIKFPDGTVQTTAAGAGGGGGKLLAIRSYTANATWSKPAGLSYVVVEVWGGGGAGQNYSSVSGAAGGASSFGAFLSATGGGKGTAAPGAGGVGSGGDINLSGQDGENAQAEDGSILGAGGAGGSAAQGGGGGGYGGFTGAAGDGKVPGGGGGGAYSYHSSGAPTGGGGGGYAKELIPAASLGATVAVTVGAGGAAATPAPGIPAGGSGAAGMVIVYEYQ